MWCHCWMCETLPNIICCCCCCLYGTALPCIGLTEVGHLLVRSSIFLHLTKGGVFRPSWNDVWLDEDDNVGGDGGVGSCNCIYFLFPCLTGLLRYIYLVFLYINAVVLVVMAAAEAINLIERPGTKAMPVAL